MRARISFDKEWIFQGSGLNALTVERVARECRDAIPGLTIVQPTSLCEAVLELNSAISREELREKITGIIRKKVSFGNVPVEPFTVEICEEGDAPAKEETPPPEESSGDGLLGALQSLLSGKGGAAADTGSRTPETGRESTADAAPESKASASGKKADDREKSREDTVSASDPEAVLARVDELIGAQEFKLLCRTIRKRCSLVIRNHTQKIFLSQSYLFSVPGGGGYTTALGLLGELLFTCGLWDRKPEVKELAMPSPAEQDIDSRLNHFMDVLGYALDGESVVSVDISEWRELASSHSFKRMLKCISEKQGKGLVVFRVPTVTSPGMDMLCNDINDILSVQKVRIPPLTPEEQTVLARRLCTEAGFVMDDSATDIFARKILLEGKDGYFYGIHTVRKVVNEMISCTESYCVEHDTADMTITAESLTGFLELEEADGADPMEKLRSLVGMEPIVAQITEIMNQLLVSRSNPGIARPSMHMLFVGNPGTGKTTVARLLGEIMYAKNLLPLGKFFEHKGRDLCGRYVGETTPKTTKICQEAYGSVLFLDEAYSLFRGEQGTNDYGREALDALVAEMENHADELVVIMAGYPGDMETMLEGNVGLRDRIPFTVRFPDYTREQLCEIFMRMVKKAFRYDDGLEECARRYFADIPEAFIGQKNFGNARFVRNLFERVWGKAGMRCCAEGKPIVIMPEDFEAAAKEFPLGEPEEKKPRIGFALD